MINTAKIDTIVAVNLDCAASYVQLVRLNPKNFNSTLARKIKAELKRINGEHKEFLKRARKPHSVMQG